MKNISCFLVIAVCSFLSFSCALIGNRGTPEQESPAYFIPEREMIKVFDGGFENEGMIHIVDRITRNRIQIKQIDYGTGAAIVYQYDQNELRWIYSAEVHLFEDNYLRERPNRNTVMLQGPLEVGTSWEDEYGASFRISDIDVEVETPAGLFKAVEVTFQRGEFEIKRYYAPGMGLIKTESGYWGTTLREYTYDLDVLDKIESPFELLVIYFR